jgi:DNA-binding response OmpR family regulator
MIMENGKPQYTVEPSDGTLRERDLSKPVVLVVDDDIRILRIVKTGLRLAGYDVVTASGGEEALALVKSVKPDIMLLDIVMTPMNGFEVLKELRANSVLPVIVMSAHTSMAAEALKVGANTFLNKPFNPDRLISEIRRLLSQADKGQG